MEHWKTEKKFPTRKAFAAWLMQHTDEIVGKPDNSCDCPVARFLKSLDWEYPEVRSTEVRISEGWKYGAWVCDLPRWAQHFVATIDAVGNLGGTLGITALNVLHGETR